jgi:hypothetical protein
VYGFRRDDCWHHPLEFAHVRPIGLTAQLVLRRLPDPATIDELFREHAQAQSERTLLFSALTELVLNFNCRDELIPIPRGLQQVYATPKVRDAILKLVTSPCLPKPGIKQAAAQLAEQSPSANLTFRAAKQRDAPQSEAART